VRATHISGVPPIRSRTITIAVDILTGVAVLVLFAVAANYFYVGANLSTAVVTLAVLSLAAGVLRGRGMPSSAWLKGMFVASGCILVSLLLGWGQMAHSVLAVFLVAEGFFIICGVQARRLWTARSVGKAVAMLLAPLGALVIVALMAIPALTWSISTRQTTQPAPAISFTALDGDIVSSPAFRGRVVVLDYWATWCPPCRGEMPKLESLYRQYRGNPEVVFWAVDVNKDGETPKKAQAFMRSYGYTLPVAFDNHKSASDLGLTGFPSLLILDRRGRVRLVHTGYDGSEPFQTELRREIDMLLGSSG
jgi:thiol-disulfide isomerase/thioredoxin